MRNTFLKNLYVKCGREAIPKPLTKIELSYSLRIVIIWSPVYDVYILKSTLALWSNHFPTWPKMSGQKFKYVQNEKKAIFIIFKRLSLKQIKSTFMEGDSSTLNNTKEAI